MKDPESRSLCGEVEARCQAGSRTGKLTTGEAAEETVEAVTVRYCNWILLRAEFVEKQ